MSRSSYRRSEKKNPEPSTNQSRELIDYGILKSRNAKITGATALIPAFEKMQNYRYAKMSNRQIYDTIYDGTIEEKRRLSKYFASISGMYERAVRYLSDIYKFDTFLYPNLNMVEDEIKDKKKTKILQRLDYILEYFDNSNLPLMMRDWAAKVCLEGVYYGYICDDVTDRFVVQHLPADYCRSRFMSKGMPVIEFNMRYFSAAASDKKTRERLIALFPSEFKKWWNKYEKGELSAEYHGDKSGWVILDTNKAFKFSFSESDCPPFLHSIIPLIELNEIQDLEKEKLLQELQKILVQTFELDKNGQLPFTMPELKQLNENAQNMLSDAVGVNVLSTIAKVHSEDMSTTQDGINRIETAQTTVYNDLGISSNLFNTDGNLALEKSVVTDEAYAKNLVLQFEQFFNNFIANKFNKNDTKFRMKILPTTIFNYKELSKSYQDLTQIGFSRFLPMVALGHSQKELISMARLEQDMLDLDLFMLPPFSSNTMSPEAWTTIKNSRQTATSSAASTTSDAGGRPALENDQKSEKTIQNQESAN